jgi:uncharacterized protein involved in exopolysaccharide biosynthesis
MLPGSTTNAQLTPIQTAQNELARLELARSKMLVNYSPSYPELKSLERQITAIQSIIDKLKTSAKAQVSSAPEPGSSQAPTQDTSAEDSSIAQLQSQLEANRVDIQNIQKYEEQQKAIIAQYQTRLNMTPVREQQLASILRDYELSKQEYTDLESKEQQSRLATNLEKQQGGQQFRLVEPPSLPERPASPPRVKLSLMGLAGGLGLGLVLAFVTQLARPTFHSTREITRRLGAPLVIGLPVILTKSEIRRGKWRRVVEFAAGSVLALAMCVAEVYVLRHP